MRLFPKRTAILRLLPNKYHHSNSFKNSKPLQIMEDRNKWIIIGLSGVTCGGKTTLANKLLDKIRPVYLFNQDKYFFNDDDLRHVKCEDVDHNDYDILSALNMDLMCKHILETIKGKNSSHISKEDVIEGCCQVQGKSFMIIEGFTVLNHEFINEICDLRYYLVLDREECVSRRSQRVYSPPDVAGYFDRCVWPHHVHYRGQIEKDNRIKVIDGTTDQQKTLETILNDVQNLCSKKQTK